MSSSKSSQSEPIPRKNKLVEADADEVVVEEEEVDNGNHRWQDFFVSTLEQNPNFRRTVRK
jgi:hypothetical protein